MSLEFYLVFGVWLIIIFFGYWAWILLKQKSKRLWDSITTPAPLKQTETKKTKLYYCNICYVISDKKGFCRNHGFPNPFKRGKSAELEHYRKLQKQYGSTSEY